MVALHEDLIRFVKFTPFDQADRWLQLNYF